MNFLKDLEEKIMEINESLPKLPKSVVEFLASWSWFFAAISAGLGLLAIITILGVSLVSSLALMGLGAGLLGLFIPLLFIVSLIGIGVSVYINFISIKPLKARLYKGWQLVLLGGLISLLFGALGDIADRDFSGLLWSLLASAISFYFMAQLRQEFTEGPELTREELKRTS